jgi:hypothetical protein
MFLYLRNAITTSQARTFYLFGHDFLLVLLLITHQHHNTNLIEDISVNIYGTPISQSLEKGIYKTRHKCHL